MYMSCVRVGASGSPPRPHCNGPPGDAPPRGMWDRPWRGPWDPPRKGPTHGHATPTVGCGVVVHIMGCGMHVCMHAMNAYVGALMPCMHMPTCGHAGAYIHAYEYICMHIPLTGAAHSRDHAIEGGHRETWHTGHICIYIIYMYMYVRLYIFIYIHLAYCLLLQ